MNSKELYKALKKLIDNPKFRKNIQNEGYNNIKHLVKNNSNFIDKIRENVVQNFSLNLIRNKLRIMPYNGL